jgi:hypothetical protein
LFGDDLDLWLCSLILDASLAEGAPIEHLRLNVEAHWARGAKLIRQDLEDCEGDAARLIIRLAEFLPEGGGATPAPLPGKGHPGEIRVKIGPVSQTFEGREPVDFCLNGPGNSPHLALMGRTRSGKTTTGISGCHIRWGPGNLVPGWLHRVAS